MQNAKIHCTDNDKVVDSKIVEQSSNWMTVLLQPGDLKLTLKKTKPDTYVGNMSGYEFVYQAK